jgi:hypothetical protein
MRFVQRKSSKGNRLQVSIGFDPSEDFSKIETLISTLDEVLSHIYSASRTIEKVESVE